MKLLKIVKLLTAAAIVTLVAGCNMLFEPENPAASGGETAQVTVTIGGNARTLLPQGIWNPDTYFSKYELKAEPTGSNPASATVPVAISPLGGTINLTYGTWDIIVTAFVNVSGTDYPAVKGSVPLTVSAGPHSVTVPVNTPEPGGTGTFNYWVQYPSAGTASVTLEPWPFGSEGTTYDYGPISGGWLSDSYSVDSGMYFLTVAVVAQDESYNYKTIIKNEIVHIHHGQITYTSYSFSPLDFGGSITLSGTITVLDRDGNQPTEDVYLFVESYTGGEIPITFTGSNGSGTWSVTLNADNLGGASWLYVYAGVNPFVKVWVNSYGIPDANVSGFVLGIGADNNPVILPSVIELTADVWSLSDVISGEPNWYSINNTGTNTYYIWLKSSDYTYLEVYSDGGYEVDWNTWPRPTTKFVTAAADTIVYIKVGGNFGAVYDIVFNTEGELFTQENADTITHDNFLIEPSYSGLHGSFNGTQNPDGSFTITTGGIRYAFPATTTEFDINDYDFVDVEYTASGVNNIVLKQYNSSDGYDDFNDDSIVNGSNNVVIFELRNATEGGFAIQKWAAGSEDMTIKITGITFKKGTRYAVTLDPGSDGTIAGGNPTLTTYVVDGTKVAHHLPDAIPNSGKVFIGWKNGTTENWAISDVIVDSTEFEDATFEAQYIDEMVISPISIDLTTVEAVGGTLTDETTTSYTYTSDGYGSGFAKFKLTLGSGEVLAALDKVKFTVIATGSDQGWKTVYLLAGETLSAGDEGEGSEMAVGSFYINASMTTAVDVTVIIDKAKAFAIEEEEFEVSLYIHAPATATYTISNVVFSQNDD